MPALDLAAEADLLRRELKFANERESLLVRIDAATRTANDPGELALAACILLGRHMHVDRCAYVFVEDNGTVFDVRGDYTDGVPSMVGRHKFADFSAASGELLRSGQNLLIEDAATDPTCADGLAAFEAAAIRSTISIPLMRDGSLSAIMVVHCRKPRHWHDNEVALVCAVGNRLWETIQRVRTLRDLQDSQERLRLAQEAGKSGAFDYFIRENRIVWTPELDRLYGIPPGSFEGSFEAWTKRVHPDDFARIEPLFAATLAERRLEIGYDFRAVQPDGSDRWLHGQAHFYYAPDGTPERMIGINVDIHERRQAEDALLRTEKLAAVGRLAASIAHEINNPLEAVTNLLFLAKGTEEAVERNSYLNDADAELRRMAAITSQTLRFHRQSTRATAVTAAELFSATLGIYAGRITAEKISIDQRLDSPHPVTCFEGEIRQVLSNLIGNAIDVMQGGGRLVLRAHETTDWRNGRRGLSLVVADTGPGMSRENMQRIFEPFFTTKGVNGTGLGLWVSHGIVERHGGSLRVRSSCSPQHHGTVFSLFLPLEPAVR